MGQSWIDLFLKTEKGHLFVAIPIDFITQNAKNSSISKRFSNVDELISLILSNDLDGIAQDDKQEQAEALYGLVHQKFLLTKEGRDLMIEKWKSKDYPEDFKCPRVCCKDFRCVPYGTSCDLQKDKVKMFCPNCTDVYNYDSNIDGAYFGPDWVHFLMNEPHDDFIPKDLPESYTPHVFGFNVYLPSNAPPTSNDH